MTSFAAVYQKDDHTLVVLTAPANSVAGPSATEDEAKAAAVVTELAAQASGLSYTGEVIALEEGVPTIPHLIGQVGVLGIALISGPSLPVPQADGDSSATTQPASTDTVADPTVTSDTPSQPTSDAAGA